MKEMIEAMIPDIALNNGKTIPQLGFGTLSVQPDRQDTAANAAIAARIIGDALQVLGIAGAQNRDLRGRQFNLAEIIPCQ